MKYQINNISVPQNKRKDINDKIIHIINNNLGEKFNISPSDIFNMYTGDGGLHGLEFKNYNSFHQYTEAKKEIENGQFFTPHNICKFIVDCIKPTKFDLIADLTYGMGNFFNYLPIESNIYGCELDIKAYKVAKYLYPNSNITADDIRLYDPEIKLDIILGNPPFNLKWKVGKEEYLSQLYYCIKSHELLKSGGLMILIVPNSFLSDEFTDGGQIKEIDKMFNFVCQFQLPSDSFKNVGVENYKTKIMVFQKKSEYLQDVSYNTNFIATPRIDEAGSNFIHNKYIKPIIEQKDKIKSKLFLENLHNSDTEAEVEFQYRVKKLLFDIKRNPKINSKYGKCEEYVNKLYNQKKPESMDYKEWEKKRVTKNKVISYLNKILKDQYKQEIDKIELVKTKYGLKLKGYSRKNKIYLSKYTGVKEITFADMILNNEYPFNDKKYIKLFKRKLNQYNRQSVPFDEVKEDAEIKKFLDDLVITDYENDITIKLNQIQKDDTNKLLQKKYNFVQWEQGSGKSIHGIANILYKFKTTTIKNVFVVAPAIAINNNWNVILNDYKMNYNRINSLSDINNIKDGEIVIITLNMLIKYQNQIKKYIKMQNQNVMLLLDESDNISNPSSKRTKAVLNCFRKVRYKTLMTGTSTRNNISEIATQFELLYNNSINMVSECQYIYEEDKKTKELKEVSNDYYMKPIPAYKKGYSLFSKSHLPQKITVFGVAQNTQDIYNSDVLKKLIDKTIITRTFEEVRGKKIYEIVQETCVFNDAERELYKRTIEEFHSMKYLFTSTGNLRKDRFLEILQQLLLMLKVCSTPHIFKEYNSKETPNKIKKVINMAGKWDNERVAIGVRHIKTVQAYEMALRRKYPNRPIFIITGDKVSLNKRKEIVKELEKTTNGILISTQQSLSSSMNIGFINKIIIPELFYNDSSMSQYYFRFIRYTSEEWKQVYFVTYENSIESNLLRLILAKEKLNLFMKNKHVDDDELYEKYGVDFNILDMLMTKERDQEGRVHIRWGEQNII